MNLENLRFNFSPKIIDCFTFYNEAKMLDFRLKELNDTVDYFVLVEATKTHKGNDKPLWFNEIKDRYKDYLDKIIHVVVDDFPETDDPWVREKFQRNAISRGLNKLNLKGLDIITITDIDEVPDSVTLQNLKYIGFNGIVSLEQDFYYYNFNHRFNYKWYHAKVCTFNKLVETGGPEAIRFHRSVAISSGGWHLSYFGSPEFISNKIKEFAHQEYNKEEYTNKEAIERRIAKGEDLFGREMNLDFKIRTKETDYLPFNWEMLK